MSLKANILRDSQGNIIVQMEGDFDYDNCLPVRDELNVLARQNPNTKINIDLGGVDFVGSSGLCHFVETLQILRRNRDQANNVSVTNITEEFKKLFRLYNTNEEEWETEFGLNEDSTRNMGHFSNKNRTFEN